MIDTRLFPLFETLAASNLGWLIVDILAMIEEGNLEMESEEAMQAAQKRVQLNQDQQSKSEAGSYPAAPRPWLGEEQIKIAADIILIRIEQSLAMTQSSINIISNLIEEKNQNNDEKLMKLAVLTGENEGLGVATFPEVEKALADIEKLRLAVKEWQIDVLGRNAST